MDKGYFGGPTPRKPLAVGGSRLKYMITSTSYPHTTSLERIGQKGACRWTRDLYHLCFYFFLLFLVVTLFSFDTGTAKTTEPIFMLNGSNDASRWILCAFYETVSLFYQLPLFLPPKPQFWGPSHVFPMGSVSGPSGQVDGKMSHLIAQTTRVREFFHVRGV